MTNTKITFRFSVAVITLIVLLSVFYKFMTYDRRYSWSKELEYETEKIAGSHGFNLDRVEEISINNIELPTERKIKISVQKLLHKVGLMNYGTEFGKSVIFRSRNSTDLLAIKAWCLGDHVLGLQVDIRTEGQTDIAKLKQDMETYFEHYDIMWTTLRQ